MLDIKAVKANQERLKQEVTLRGVSGVDVDVILELDELCRHYQDEYDSLRSRQKKAGPSAGKELKRKVQEASQQLKEARDNLNELMLRLPNFMAKDTPIGTEDTENVEIQRHGQKPEFDFQPKDHVELGEKYGLNLELGTNLAGAGFSVMKGRLALLERAIMQFVLDEASQQGFEFVQIPLVARPDILQGIGFSPRREDAQTEIFNLADDNLCLAGTAEIGLVGQMAGQSLDTKSLPIKYVAHTPCFRREGGAGGRRDRGLYRQKMFNKVELVVASEEETAEQMLENILRFEVDIFKKLGVYFRVVRICAGDLGAPAFKKYDLEGWMYSRHKEGEWGWGELTSCSNCTDFQSRRLGIYHKESGTKGRGALVHTLNGTGITTRALIPLLEQFQQADGKIKIPKVLKSYLNQSDFL